MAAVGSLDSYYPRDGHGEKLGCAPDSPKVGAIRQSFLELNFASLPEHLVEAELFGYRKRGFQRRFYFAAAPRRELMGCKLKIKEGGDGNRTDE